MKNGYQPGEGTGPLSPAETSFQNWVFNEIINQMNANIYVTDIETDRILFMNKNMQRAFGVDQPEGKICWQVLQEGIQDRCAFCPVDILRQKNAGQEHCSHLWEEENTLNGRVYENYDSLMRWRDGRLVHFRYSVDVTETKQLTLAASTDELTGVLNRRAGKEQLKRTMELCHQQQVPLTVAMFDVNDLKLVNDTYGHQAGDVLLTTISAAVRDGLGPEEYLFRMSGDEFLVVFPDCHAKKATSVLEKVLYQLRSLNLYPSSRRGDEFCFGLLEITPERVPSLEELFSAVDERLYIQKRLLHIKKAEQRLRKENQRHQPVPLEAFTYDKSNQLDEQGDPALFAGFITNLGKNNQIDHITGLFNKFEFQTELQRLLDQREALTLLLFGIDDLKRINHLYDRAFGDEVIRITAQKLQTLLPATARLFRLDGDEIGVILRGNTGRETSKDLYAIIQGAFCNQQTLADKKFFCTLSCGCVPVPQGTYTDYQELHKHASYALEYAKHRGKNRLEFFSADILAHMERSLELTEKSITSRRAI